MRVLKLSKNKEIIQLVINLKSIINLTKTLL